jgi:methyl-accepting chemotaxis protein
MQAGPLASGSVFIRRLLMVVCAHSAFAVALIALYLRALLRLPPEQWVGFFQIVAVSFVVLFAAIPVVHRRSFLELQRAVDALRDPASSPERFRSGFAAVSDYPRWWFIVGVVWWAVGGVLVAGAMCLRYADFTLFSGAVMVLAAITGGFISDISYFFTMKRYLGPLRRRLAGHLRDPELRGSLVKPVPITAKLLLSGATMTVFTVLFATLLAQLGARQAVEAHALRSLRALAAAAAERLEAGSGDLASLEREAARLGIEARLYVLAGAGGAPADAPLAPHEEAAIREGGASGGAAGAEQAFAWQRLGDGRVAVARTGGASLAPDLGGVAVTFSALLVTATLLAIGIALLQAQDLARTAKSLRVAALRIASGDLREGDPLDSEDELGDLARSFDSMTLALRATVTRVAQAADRVEHASGAIGGAAHSVTHVSRAQVAGVEQAAVSMRRIDEQVREIATASQTVRESMEEAASSLVELGSTSEQLRENTLAFSARTEAVVEAVQELNQSVIHVAGNADVLAAAASDVSSSMEETSAAVREVDANSERTSRLATRTSSSADHGRERVHQTIRSMEAIHEATDTAQRQIHALGDRIRDIGGVLDVIDDVADETNLLALNAAIIAAQAGEQGRPFTVVATQIKALANRVREHTKEIAELIQAVKDESANVTQAIAGGTERVRSGVTLWHEAGSALDEIAQAARESQGHTTEIRSAVQEQANAVRHVADLMERVREGVSEIHAALVEQRRNADHLHEGTAAMGDTAKHMGTATAEQATSTRRVQSSIEQIADAIARIHDTLQEQSRACASAFDFVEGVRREIISNETSVRSLETESQALQREAENLRQEVGRFRL